MWKAPPPPSEPLEEKPDRGWADTKATTERRLFGDGGAVNGGGVDGEFEVTSNTAAMSEPVAVVNDNDR